MKGTIFFHKDEYWENTPHDQQIDAILWKRRQCRPFNLGKDRHLHRKVVRCYPRGYVFYRLALLEGLK
ncbi:hypothetical protein [Xenorhabdus lircayensis]|uniref:Transposase n=1 Tax=Xenorhabdus lircayensis TaxID=2763499 RepID=A0ABS0UDI2_9GAMM|nr:hypothetical protein [Xenorhabdus lircayensis]MBI6550710.1 hypothetical protein [Xenorhabdus lircayensis]